MSRRLVQHHGQKARTKADKDAAAFIARTWHRDAPSLTDDERDELIRKAGR